MNTASITITVKGNTKHLYERGIISKKESSDSREFEYYGSKSDERKFDLNGIVRMPDNLASSDEKGKWIAENWGCYFASSRCGVCDVKEDDEKIEISAYFGWFAPHNAVTTLANMFDDMEVTAVVHPLEAPEQEFKEENGIEYTRVYDVVEHMDRNGEWTCEESFSDWSVCRELTDGEVSESQSECKKISEDDNPF